jgi:hypothetical protein
VAILNTQREKVAYREKHLDNPFLVERCMLGEKYDPCIHLNQYPRWNFNIYPIGTDTNLKGSELALS